jgi:replicative DNA helicase Mcm
MKIIYSEIISGTKKGEREFINISYKDRKVYLNYIDEISKKEIEWSVPNIKDFHSEFTNLLIKIDNHTIDNHKLIKKSYNLVLDWIKTNDIKYFDSEKKTYSESSVSCISCISSIQNKDTDTEDTIHTNNTIDTKNIKDTNNNIYISKLFITNKDVILYIIYSNSNISIKEITEKTTILLSTVKNIIHRADTSEGLLDIGLIQLVDTNPNKYQITPQGKDYIESIIKNHEQKQLQHQQQQAHEQTLRQEIDNLKLHITDKYKTKLAEKQSNGKKHISFDFNDLVKWNPILCDELLNNPIETLKKIEIAVESILDHTMKARIFNIPKSQRIKIGNIRVENIGKLYAIEGIIKQRSQVKPMVTMIKFECPACGNIIPLLQMGQTVKDARCGCGRKGKMTELSKELINLQVLKLEELPEQLDGRTDCQTISVILKDDLTAPTLQNFYNPGSRIRINGIVYERPIFKNREKDVVMNMIFEANYVEPQEKQMVTSYSKEDMVKIQKLSKDKHIVKKLCDSFMPDLVGINEQKLAALLSIVKGGNAPRQELHCLFAGEPGLAKSEILKRIPTLFKTARYANGASSSSVGLTASVIKDELSGGWGLQAGTVVMANEGIACIDELDKMKEEEKNDLNECAEQGTVTINKAGISGSLQAKTTLIMASNPKHHMFDSNTNLLTQLNLPFALITRFDLLFILKNTPQQMLERMEIINNIDYDNINVPIEEELLIKYIMVARDSKPKLSVEAKEEIMKIMRLIVSYKLSGEDEIPLTVRQLHAIRRISTAFAKLRLSNSVEKVDVKKAWEIYKHSLQSVHGKDMQNNLFNSTDTENVESELKTNLMNGETIQVNDKNDREIKQMLNAGDVFEVKPGFVRRL